MKILIADDDAQVLRALRITLTARGYTVLTASNGAEALSAAIDHHPDLNLLDLGMPELDGIEVIHAIRGWSRSPILVISGRTDSYDAVEALDAGADDFVTKPFAIDELLARIRALTRRATADDRELTIRLGTITIDIAARSITQTTDSGPRHIRLTPTEWLVLDLLARHPGKLVTRRTLLSSIWGTEHIEDTGYLRLYISQLRKKIEPEPSKPRFLLTEPGMGYRLELDDS